jgi:hypothetical protein
MTPASDRTSHVTRRETLCPSMIVTPAPAFA